MTSGRSGAGLGLIAEAASFRRLFLATFASSIGTWLAFVALVVDVYDRTGDANWVSALLVADFLPIVLVGILLGPLIDRLPRRNILVAADALRAGVFCVLPFATSAAQIVGLALIIGIATSLFRPAVFAGLPNLVADDDLGHANGILQSAENFAWAVGALAGGALVATSGPDAAYWLNAGTFVVSALFILGIRQSLEERERSASAGHRRDLVEGLRMVTRSRSLLTILVAWSIVTLGQAIGNVSEIVLAKEEFNAGDFGYGVLVATAAIGLTIGSLAGGDVDKPFRDPRPLRRRRRPPCSRVRGGGCFSERLGSGCLRGRLGPRERRGRRVQCRARPARRAGPLARTRVHGGHEHRLRLLRSWDDRGRPAHEWVRCADGLGHLGGSLCRGSVLRSRAPLGRRGARVAGRPDTLMARTWSLDELVAGVRSGDRRALARAITLAESADSLAEDVIRELYGQTGPRVHGRGHRARPGVGKSSLVSSLVRHVRPCGQTVGVVTVDPSSPFTQGALLGDRIRLADHFLDPDVFIRSMGTRGHLGGLAEATLQAALILDAAGKDLLFLETVGTGQSEVEIVGIADTTLLVLMPGSGDSIQALKAGIMEIPDVIAVNKKDRTGAKTMASEVRSILALDTEREWETPIVLTDAVSGDGVEELWDCGWNPPGPPRGDRASGEAPRLEPRPPGVRVGERPSQGTPGAGGGWRRGSPSPARAGGAPRAGSLERSA